MDSFRQRLVAFLRLPALQSLASVFLQMLVRMSVTANADRHLVNSFTVMQVGGRDGSDPYTKWVRMRGKAKTIGVEPESGGLAKIQAGNAYDHIVTQAFSNTVGTAPLYITKAKGWCSLLQPDEAAIAKVAVKKCMERRPFELTGTEQVQVTTIDTIKHTLPPIDYLQIDVQGAELLVLQGAEQTLKDIFVIELETRFYPIYHHEAIFKDTHAFFEKNGFVLLQMNRQGEHEFGDTLVEVNACYYNKALAVSQPARMTMLQEYARAKYGLYSNSLLRLWGDIAA